MRTQMFFRGCLHYIQWEFFVLGNELIRSANAIRKAAPTVLSRRFAANFAHKMAFSL